MILKSYQITLIIQAFEKAFKSQVKASVMKDMANSNSDGWEALGEMLAVAMVDKACAMK